MSEQIFPLPLPCQTVVLCYLVEAASFLSGPASDITILCNVPAAPCSLTTESKPGELADIIHIIIHTYGPI